MNIKNYNSQEIGLAKAYVKQGQQCDIVYYAGDEASHKEYIEAADGKTITIYWKKGFSIANNGFFPGINRIIEQYDVIQVSEYYFWTSWYVYWKYGKTKKVYIYQGVYDADNSRRFQIRCKIMDPILLRKRLLKNTPVFTKSILAEQTMRKRGFEQIVTVGVGIDLEQLIDKAEATAFSEKLRKEKNDRFFMLYVGVMEDRRNIIFMLRMLRYIADRVPNVCLVMVGKGQEQYEAEVNKTIEELHLSGHILWTKMLSQGQLKSVYEQADLFLLPSKYEIFGMVILEAMSQGVSVVSSLNGGSSTLIQNGVNGVIIEEFDEKKWGDNAIALLHNHQQRVDIAIKAKNTVNRDYSWDCIAGQILAKLSK